MGLAYLLFAFLHVFVCVDSFGRFKTGNHWAHLIRIRQFIIMFYFKPCINVLFSLILFVITRSQMSVIDGPLLVTAVYPPASFQLLLQP